MPFTLKSLREFVDRIEGPEGDELRTVVDYATAEKFDELDPNVLRSAVENTDLEPLITLWLNAEAARIFDLLDKNSPTERELACKIVSRISKTEDREEAWAIFDWLVEKNPNLQWINSAGFLQYFQKKFPLKQHVQLVKQYFLVEIVLEIVLRNYSHHSDQLK